MAILTVGIDLAKNVLALYGVNEVGEPELLVTFAVQAGCTLGPHCDWEVNARGGCACFASEWWS